jgi:hypothetical protein
MRFHHRQDDQITVDEPPTHAHFQGLGIGKHVIDSLESGKRLIRCATTNHVGNAAYWRWGFDLYATQFSRRDAEGSAATYIWVDPGFTPRFNLGELQRLEINSNPSF